MNTLKHKRLTGRNIAFGLATGIPGLILAVAVQTFARPCVHNDGSAAACAAVASWLTAEGGAVAVLAGISMIRPIPAVQGTAAAGGLLAVLTPGVIVPVCRHEAMACRRVTQPVALVLGVMILAAALWWMVLTLISKKKDQSR